MIPTMQYTTNFVWCTSDLLGHGATSYVYKGREKKTGKEYAIKVFNSRSTGTKFAEARKRELDMLKKVDHENIIRFFNVEEEIFSRQDVIIMELCTAGSLQTFLEDPINLHGLDEDELKRLLKHITAGMKHLHAREIVHRDLKPGNITRTFTEDGSPVYKLTDFGAARELGYEEHFQSLCGTEEYLHPDIYERAILRKPLERKFSATVDLWSIGVTLYQAATGELPFRPYGGTRKNREMMLRITTEKPTGAISGYQASAHENIQWSVELPKTCRLSQGFKRYFVPLLAGILECDPQLSWTFTKFFDEVDRVLRMRVIDLFYVSSATLLKIYTSPEKKLLTFQSEVAQLTGVPLQNQLLLFDGAEFEVDHDLPVQKYPLTDTTRPFILMGRKLTELQKISIPHTCKPPKFKSSMSCENDASLAKVCSKTLYDIGKTISSLLNVQDLIRLSIKWFTSYLKARLINTRLACSEIESRLKCLKTSLDMFEEHCRQETSLLRVISKMVSTPPIVQEMTLYFTEITEKAKYIAKMQKEFDQINDRIRKYEKSIIQDEVPTSVFIDDGSRPEERLKERITMYSEKSHQIYKTFKRQKTTRSLSRDERQEHVFEKQKLAELCEFSISLLLEQCVPASRRLHKESQTWFTNMIICLNEVESCERKLTNLSRRSQDQVEPVKTLQKIYQKKMSELQPLLYDIALKQTRTPCSEESNSCAKPPSGEVEKI